ncbi:unnamed protein product [Polarella glacialis]|uniref:Fatty acid desaturase domain-containing protein n=1 Tax=Polarella glacialis TaxID=89957 RepID=A0A813KCY5_POLGL|nr:unnamed protein product [Polarella glacialis]
MATPSSSTEGWSFRDTYVGPISLATGIAYLFYIAHETAALGFRGPPAAFGAVAKRCSDPFNNTTCVEVEAQSEVGVVNVDRMIAMASFTALLLTVVIALCFAKLPEAIDSKHNNRGLAQFSSLFYRKGGAFTDFLNGLPYVLNLLPTATVYMGIYLYRESGNDWATWFTFIAGFVLVPLFDLIVGEDSYNPTPAEEAALIKNPWFSRHLILYTWAYVAGLGALCCYIGQQSGYIGGGPNVLSPVAFWGIAISTGIASGFGIGCIHELMHRPTFFEMNHSRLVLLFSNYNQFWVEHLWGHHKRVATDEDPASSSLNEPFWTFIFRCIWQSLVSALRLEAKFQERKRGAHFFASRTASSCRTSSPSPSTTRSTSSVAHRPSCSSSSNPGSPSSSRTTPTTSSTTACAASVSATGRTSGVSIRNMSAQAGCTRGTRAIASPTGCSSRSSATPTTTSTRAAHTRSCAP